MNPSKLSAALAAAERGWKVFPLVPNRKTPSKLMNDWEAKATSDPDRIRRWWTNHPRDNVAIATGPSRLVIIDLDVPKPGEQPPEQWAACVSGLDVLTTQAARHEQSLPVNTYTVRTPSQGLHLYFTAPEGTPLRNTKDRAGWKIDTRAAGGYIVAAGSTVDRTPYELVHNVDPLPVLPAWLVELLTPLPPPDPATLRPISAQRDRVGRALTRWVGRVLDSPPDHHNNTLNRAAYFLAPYIAAGLLPRVVVENALQQAGQAVGQSPREAAATIRSGINAGLRKNPRSIS